MKSINVEQRDMYNGYGYVGTPLVTWHAGEKANDNATSENVIEASIVCFEIIFTASKHVYFKILNMYN